MSRIYKILSASEWEAAKTAERFDGSAVDLKDGYIHFSTSAQAQETARRHFHGVEDLVVLSVPVDALGPELRWEKSRGGDPYLVEAVTPAPLGADGVPDLSDLVP